MYVKAEAKLKTCQKCGKSFEVGRTPDGRHFKNIKICPDCSQLPKTKILTCQACGKQFSVGKYPGTNSFIKRKLCDECLNKRPEIKKLICQKCGKVFEVGRYSDGHFKVRKYCDDCSKPAETKWVQCDNCGKWFEVDRVKNPQHGFSLSKYCSDICANIGFKEKTKQTCQSRYGVDYPCLTDNAINANTGNVVSKINEKFAAMLDNNNIEYEQEFRLGSYSYDFYIGTKHTLIEINPTYTHRTQDNTFGKGKDKNYHLDKTNYANKQSFRCIHVWDWDSWDSIMSLIMNNKNKVYARKLKLMEIKNKDVINSFLEKKPWSRYVLW